MNARMWIKPRVVIRRRSSCCLVLSFRVLGRELRRSCAIDGGEVVTAIVVVIL